MADASLRTRLEEVQARAVKLRPEVLALPPVSTRRATLSGELEAARASFATEKALAARLHAEELAMLARYEPGVRNEFRGRWWQSQLAPVAIVVAGIGAFNLVLEALEYVSWPQFGTRWQWWLAAIPLVVNGARVVRGAWRWRRSVLAEPRQIR